MYVLAVHIRAANHQKANMHDLISLPSPACRPDLPQPPCFALLTAHSMRADALRNRRSSRLSADSGGSEAIHYIWEVGHQGQGLTSNMETLLLCLFCVICCAVLIIKNLSIVLEANLKKIFNKLVTFHHISCTLLCLPLRYMQHHSGNEDMAIRYISI